jgi:hypothetical protein
MKKDDKLVARIAQILEAEKIALEDSGDRLSILATMQIIESVEEPVKQVGRKGTFWIVGFEYSVEYMDGAKDEDGNELESRFFQRSARFDESGMVTGVSDPVEIDN